MKTLILKHRLLISFIFYEIVISARIFTEMGLCSIHTFIHQLVWFNTVLLFFYLGFRKILKIEYQKLWILSAGSILTFIPLIFSYFAGHQWTLNYIEPQSFQQVLTDMATLLCCHNYNWPMFPELFLLFSGSLGLGFYFSKDFKRSLLCSATSFYGSFFLLGFSWIAVNREHPTLFLLDSSFSDSKFYSLQIITYFILATAAANYKTVYGHIKDHRKVQFHALNFFMIIIFYSVIIFMTDKPLTIADNIVTVIPILLISYTLKNIKKYRNLENIVWIWISGLSVIVMLTASAL